MPQRTRPGLGAPIAQTDAFAFLQKAYNLRNDIFADAARIGSQVGTPGFGNSGPVKDMVPDKKRLPEA